MTVGCVRNGDSGPRPDKAPYGSPIRPAPRIQLLNNLVGILAATREAPELGFFNPRHRVPPGRTWLGQGVSRAPFVRYEVEATHHHQVVILSGAVLAYPLHAVEDTMVTPPVAEGHWTG